MANLNGTLLFEVLYATEGDNNYATALWRSDGTPSGTELVYDFGIRFSDYEDQIEVIDGVAYFPGRDFERGEELWRSDGTWEGTWRVAEIATGNAGARPSNLTNMDGVLYFTANDGSGHDLWKSDGSAAGTVRVKDLDPNATSARIDRMVVAKDRLYFFRYASGLSSYELWMSDGSEEGTFKGPLLYAASTEAIILGNRLVFEAAARAKSQLTITDGSAIGTQMLRWAETHNLTSVNGIVFFVDDGIWKTDGTVAGTVLIKDEVALGGRPSYLTNANGTLFFRSDGALWKSDGTEAGTVLVDDSLSVDNLYAVGNTLYIINRDPVIGTEPWVLRVAPQSNVVGRHLFYNDSSFDGDSTAANAADDGAIAPEKIAHLPGMGPATTASVSSFVHGINGIMIDIAGLEGELTVDDFDFRIGTSSAPEAWEAAPAPLEIVVRAGAGANGSDRVTITWANGAIKNTWLQVIVKGYDAAGGFNTNTGLAESDVFFFGSRVGDTFAGATSWATMTNIQDELAARFTPSAAQSITSTVDFNRDGLVNVADQLIARMNAGVLLMLDFDSLAESLVAADSTEMHARAALAFALAIGDDDADGGELPHDAWRGRKL